MAALYSVLLKLKSENEAVISPTQGYHAYALFLNLIRLSNPAVAEALHNLQTNKPFTLSSLQGSFVHIDKSLKLKPDTFYSIRLTFMAEDIFCYFMDAVLKAGNQSLRLESAVFGNISVQVNRLESQLCHYQTFEELADISAAETRITLHFSSPVTFRSGGKRNLLLPDPFLILGSYWNRWQTFSTVKLEDILAVSRDKIFVSRYRLNTRILHFNGYQETGFEGQCSLDLSPELGFAGIKALNTLADFAFYCGTGAKTTMGMGQTRRIYDRSTASSSSDSWRISRAVDQVQ